MSGKQELASGEALANRELTLGLDLLVYFFFLFGVYDEKGSLL